MIAMTAMNRWSRVFMSETELFEIFYNDVSRCARGMLTVSDSCTTEQLFFPEVQSANGTHGKALLSPNGVSPNGIGLMA
jgi:hypothetical protein